MYIILAIWSVLMLKPYSMANLSCLFCLKLVKIILKSAYGKMLKYLMLRSHSGEMYSKQHYVIRFVSDMRQVGGFLWFSSTNKTDSHDITEILLKMVLNTINLSLDLFCEIGFLRAIFHQYEMRWEVHF